jgi:glutathione S-transferase
LAEAAEKALRVPLAVLEQHLQHQQAQGNAYLAANRFTVADLCVASVVSWVRPAQDVLAQLPAIDAWLTACVDRPAHKQARGMK